MEMRERKREKHSITWDEMSIFLAKDINPWWAIRRNLNIGLCSGFFSTESTHTHTHSHFHSRLQTRSVCSPTVSHLRLYLKLKWVNGSKLKVVVFPPKTLDKTVSTVMESFPTSATSVIFHIFSWLYFAKYKQIVNSDPRVSYKDQSQKVITHWVFILIHTHILVLLYLWRPSIDMLYTRF